MRAVIYTIGLILIVDGRLRPEMPRALDFAPKVFGRLRQHYTLWARESEFRTYGKKLVDLLL